MVSSYAMFVKEHIHKFKHLPAKERMKAVAELYHKQKGDTSKKGGAILHNGKIYNKSSDLYNELAAEKKAKKKGGSLLGSIGDIIGLGLDDNKGGAMTAGALHKKRGRPSKKGGSFGPMGDFFGLGLDDNKGGIITAAGLHKKRGRPSKKGGSLLGSIGDFIGLGLDDNKGGIITAAGLHKKRGRPSKKGGAMTAGALNPYAHVQSPLMSGSGGGFGDWFFKGLTAPFALASKIPLPGLQQIGQAATKGFNAIGAPTLF